MYSSAAIANCFLQIAWEEDKGISPLKLQKLVYIAHGWYLGLTEEPLCLEYAEAWRWGPVFSDLYHEVKEWGSGPVEELARVWSDEMEKRVVPDPVDDYAERVIRWVWERYSAFSGLKLSAITHETGTPWHQTWTENRYLNANIPDGRIRDHFRDLLERLRHG